MSQKLAEIYSTEADNYKNYKFYQPPPVVGYWSLSPNFFIGMTKKPNWFHRKMVTFVFGWEWRDGKI